MLEEAGFSGIVCRELHIDAKSPDLTEWEKMVAQIKNRSRRVKIGIVGKYVQLHDAYLSVAEALHHAGYVHNAFVDIEWIDSEQITKENVAETLKDLAGVIVPGGFGSRGIEGMILTAEYARTHKLPYLGICLGMQIAVIEFARNVLGWADANSGEFAPDSEHKVIDFMPGQYESIEKGGTLRLGAYPCKVKSGSLLEKCYGSAEISERHRHRYEFNNDFKDALVDGGLELSGMSPDGTLVETIEIADHPFYIGVQFHPELKSRPNRPHPLFLGLVENALK